jgi:hypothetical protein
MVGQDMGMGKLGTQAEKDRRLKKKYVFHPKHTYWLKQHRTTHKLPFCLASG